MVELQVLHPNSLGARLRATRESSGVTQQQLATSMGLARTTIVAMEKGERRVQPRELVRLADALGVTVSDLIQRGAPAEAFSAQLRSTLPAGPVDPGLLPGLKTFQDLAEDYVRLENLRGASMRPRTPPRIELGSQDPELVAEDAAFAERQRLGLGDAPITDLRTMLENDLGLRIFQLALPSRIAGVYAFTAELGGCIAVNVSHPIERRRLSLAHEYGHFLENREQAKVVELSRYSRRPQSERFAESFAWAFLMPEQGLRRRFLDLNRQRGGTPTLADALRLARSYIVSAEAMIRRLEGLRLVSAGTWDRLQAEGLRVADAQRMLGLDLAPEDNQLLPPRFIDLALEAWKDGQLSEGQLTRLLREDRMLVRERVEGFEEVMGSSGSAITLAAPLSVRRS